MSVKRDGRDADRELPEQVIRRGAGEGRNQALDLLAGLLAEYPRDEVPGPRHVTDIEVDFATTRRRP
jgi:hypothetical protein